MATDSMPPETHVLAIASHVRLPGDMAEISKLIMVSRSPLGKTQDKNRHEPPRIIF